MFDIMIDILLKNAKHLIVLKSFNTGGILLKVQFHGIILIIKRDISILFCL